jgi:glycosyltransferase involved in cell wall biosynthesis
VKLLFLVTNDWYFWTHRLALARAVRDAGAQVLVMTHINEHGDALRAEGFHVIPWSSMAARSVNPFREVRAVWEVLVAYCRFRPDLIHHIALKPALYGGMVAILLGKIPSLQTIAGLGYLFTDPPRRLSWLRWLVLAGLWLVQRMGRVKTAFQNTDDRDFFIGASILRSSDSVLIRGSGVNLEVLSPLPEPCGIPVVTLASRMLWDKGIGEFVQAADILKRRGINARFALAGRVDRISPGNVSEEQLSAWASTGRVEWWGHAQDIRTVFARSNVVCLPSYYREGLPKVLLEASACERAVIAADSPGCRECVRHGENGLLVTARNADALAEAIRELLEDSCLRKRMAKRGRQIVEQEFSEGQVIRETFAVYSTLLDRRWPHSPTTVSKERANMVADV